MQFKSIIAVLSVAAVAIALPVENIEERNPTYCNVAGTYPKCCNTVTSFLGQLVGVDCVGVLNVLSPTCSTNQQAACCDQQAPSLVALQLCPNLAVF
ncbi:hypothetical protein MMC13_002400 [Lambiella insularis]|nr:hypothetical protein [Lambiella insularis]